MIGVALFLAQAVAAAPPSPPSPPQRFSILADPCASDGAGKDVVVCGRPDAISPRLPMRDLRPAPDHPMPSNPDMTGTVALNGPGVDYLRECGAYGENCPVFGGGYILPKLTAGAIDLARRAFARKPDKRGRVAIDLDTPPPPIPATALRR